MNDAHASANVEAKHLGCYKKVSNLLSLPADPVTSSLLPTSKKSSTPPGPTGKAKFSYQLFAVVLFLSTKYVW